METETTVLEPELGAGLAHEPTKPVNGHADGPHRHGPGGKRPASKATRMYFLRVPKPDLSDLKIQKEKMDYEVSCLREACAKSLARAKVANEIKLKHKEEYECAIEQMNSSRADRNNLADRLQPFQERQKSMQANKSNLVEQRRALPATTVADLDDRIKRLEHRHDHETMDKQEEKNVMAEIKKLKKLRPEVERFESQQQQFDAKQYDVDAERASKEDLERNFRLVRDEFNMAREQMVEKKNLFFKARDAHRAASEEFESLRKQLNELQNDAGKARQLLHTTPDKYFENRRFSQQVRMMLGERKVAEAAKMCSDLTDSLIAELMSDPNRYRDYVSDWELQRKYAVSEAEIDLESMHKPRSKANGSSVPFEPLPQTHEIMADIMAEIEGRPKPSQQNADREDRATALLAGPRPISRPAVAPRAPPPQAAAAPSAAALDLESMALPPQPQPVSKPQAPLKPRVAKPAAPAPFKIDDEFELPVVPPPRAPVPVVPVEKPSAAAAPAAPAPSPGPKKKTRRRRQMAQEGAEQGETNGQTTEVTAATHVSTARAGGVPQQPQPAAVAAKEETAEVAASAAAVGTVAVPAGGVTEGAAAAAAAAAGTPEAEKNVTKPAGRPKKKHNSRKNKSQSKAMAPPKKASPTVTSVLWNHAAVLAVVAVLVLLVAAILVVVSQSD